MSDLPQPIKELGKATLTKAANKFVDLVITKYTGKSIKVFEAEGDVEADKVKSKWELIEKPFWLQAEAAKMFRQYTNMGKVLQKAAPLITSKQNLIFDDNDVFWGFMEHSKEISNNEMQQLIAGILAGEYNCPSTYSMCTLQTIKMLGKNELELFKKVCGLLIDGERLPQNLFIGRDDVKEFTFGVGIDFGSLQSLQSLGLFLPNEMTQSLIITDKDNLTIRYFNKVLTYVPTTDNISETRLPGFYGLSLVGKQIVKHLTFDYVDKFYLWLRKNYKIPNYELQDSGI